MTKNEVFYSYLQISRESNTSPEVDRAYMNFQITLALPFTLINVGSHINFVLYSAHISRKYIEYVYLCYFINYTSIKIECAVYVFQY